MYLFSYASNKASDVHLFTFFIIKIGVGGGHPGVATFSRCDHKVSIPAGEYFIRSWVWRTDDLLPTIWDEYVIQVSSWIKRSEISFRCRIWPKIGFFFIVIHILIFNQNYSGRTGPAPFGWKPAPVSLDCNRAAKQILWLMDGTKRVLFDICMSSTYRIISMS